MDQLLPFLNQTIYDAKEAELLIECHAAAEQLTSTVGNLKGALQDMCETIIAMNFQLFLDQSYAMDSKLSTASVLRVAQRAVQLESNKAAVMRDSLYTCALTARTMSHASNLFIAAEDDLKQGIKPCPVCSGSLRSVREYGDPEWVVR